MAKDELLELIKTLSVFEILEISITYKNFKGNELCLEINNNGN